jgi:hypothetical protein
LRERACELSSRGYKNNTSPVQRGSAHPRASRAGPVPLITLAVGKPCRLLLARPSVSCQPPLPGSDSRLEGAQAATTSGCRSLARVTRRWSPAGWRELGSEKRERVRERERNGGRPTSERRAAKTTSHGGGATTVALLRRLRSCRSKCK